MRISEILMAMHCGKKPRKARISPKNKPIMPLNHDITHFQGLIHVS